MAVRKHEFNEDEHKQQNVKRSRITFDVTPELRRRIKVAAAQNNLSVGEYLGHIIEREIPKEPQEMEKERRPMTRKSSERLRNLRERILEDRNGEKFEDSTEMIRQMREDRAQYLEASQREDIQK